MSDIDGLDADIESAMCSWHKYSTDKLVMRTDCLSKPALQVW